MSWLTARANIGPVHLMNEAMKQVLEKAVVAAAV